MHDIDGITSGSQLLSPTGRIWTVRSITPCGTRVVLTSAEPDGEHGAVIDLAAARRMIRLDEAATASSPEPQVVEPANFARA